ITDNATTAINLLDSDAWATDMRMEQFFGTADNPDVAMLLTGIQVVGVHSIETAAKLREIQRSLYLEHVAGSDTYLVNLYDAFCTNPMVAGYDGAAAPTAVYQIPRQEPV